MDPNANARTIIAATGLGQVVVAQQRRMTLEEYRRSEARLWHDAWSERGLRLNSMSVEEAQSVREIDERYAAMIRS